MFKKFKKLLNCLSGFPPDSPKVRVMEVDVVLKAAGVNGGLSGVIEKAKRTGRDLKAEVVKILKGASVDKQAAQSAFQAAMAQVDEKRLEAGYKQADAKEIEKALESFREN